MSDLSNWMEQLPSTVKERPINRIVLPMAHDAAACGIAAALSTSNSETKAYRVARAMRLPVVRTVIAEFATCQEVGVYRLLESGVRCLDVRVTYDDRRNAFVCSHCVAFPRSDLVGLVSDVARFLTQHTGEVVVWNLQDDWDHRKNLRTTLPRSAFRSSNLYRGAGAVPLDDFDDAHLLQTPSDALGEWLALHSPLASLLLECTDNLPTLTQMISKNKRCIIITRPSISPDSTRCAANTCSRLFSASFIDGHWPDASTTTDLEQKCRARIAQPPSANASQFVTLAFTHTADGALIKSYVQSKFLCRQRRNLKSLAYESRILFSQFLNDPDLYEVIRFLNADLLNQICLRRTNGMKQFSCIQFDFNDAILNQQIILLNM